MLRHVGKMTARRISCPTLKEADEKFSFSLCSIYSCCKQVSRQFISALVLRSLSLFFQVRKVECRFLNVPVDLNEFDTRNFILKWKPSGPPHREPGIEQTAWGMSSDTRALTSILERKTTATRKTKPMAASLTKERLTEQPSSLSEPTLNLWKQGSNSLSILDAYSQDKHTVAVHSTKTCIFQTFSPSNSLSLQFILSVQNNEFSWWHFSCK